MEDSTFLIGCLVESVNYSFQFFPIINFIRPIKVLPMESKKSQETDENQEASSPLQIETPKIPFDGPIEIIKSILNFTTSR
jgi:hypothetical protein